MKTLETLIAQETTAADALVMAKKQHALALQALYNPIQDLCERYKTLFEPIQSAVESLPLAIPELNPSHLPSENRWGNHGLNRLVHLPNGFTEIHTNDYFRNEWGRFSGRSAIEVFGGNGISLMEKDAKRVHGDIAGLASAHSTEQPAAPC